MPSSAQLLDQLANAAARAALVSMGWHAVLGAVLVAISMGWRPSGRVAGVVLAASCVSVAVVAAFGNPFNAMVFGALALVLAATSLRDRTAVSLRFSIAGAAALAFGWIYPHFVAFPANLYAAPVGVVPCATLYVVVGATLSGFAPRGLAFRRIVGLAALVYGVFGVFVLHVWIDLGLVVAHVLCIRSSHAIPPPLHRDVPRCVPGRKDVGPALGVGAKYDHQRANRSA